VNGGMERNAVLNWVSSKWIGVRGKVLEICMHGGSNYHAGSFESYCIVPR
jgi:hypothetical protein